MKRKEFIAQLKQKLLTPDTYADKPEWRAELEEQVANATNIGDLFEVMCANSFVVSDAIATALEIVVTDTCKGEFSNVPIRGWDT